VAQGAQGGRIEEGGVKDAWNCAWWNVGRGPQGEEMYEVLCIHGGFGAEGIMYLGVEYAEELYLWESLGVC